MTLIEALAAFVILSIGLLGIVSLQALSKSAQHQAIQRSRAVAIGNDMLERVRTNPAGLPTYDIGLTPIGKGTIETEPSPNCATATCTPAQLAAHDLWNWEQSLDGAAVTVVEGGVMTNTAGLINPQGCTQFIADTGKTRTGIFNVIIQWRGLSETSDAVAEGEIVCGGAAAEADRFRRQIIVSSYVLDGTEI